MKRSFIAAAMLVPGLAMAQAVTTDDETVRGTQIEEGGTPEYRDGDSATDVRDADGSRGDPNSAAVRVEDDEVVRGTQIDEGKPEFRDGDAATDVRDADGSRGDPNSAAVTVEDDELVRGTEIDEGETAEPADENVQTDPRDADGNRPANSVLGDG